MCLKLTNSSFIAKANAIHNNLYDYALIDYVNYDTKLAITCKQHGIFYQNPNNHLLGKGCPACKGNKRMDTESFIEKANLVHSGKFSYLNTVYVNNKSKVIVTCHQHGDFYQAAGSHLSGRGCAKCVVKKSNGFDFINKAKAIHGDKYDYSLVNYTDCKSYVSILCKTHGVFEQVPNGHLNGAGCSICSNIGPSTPELELSAYVSSLIGVKLSDRSVIYPKEIDCYIPSKKLGIEFCGLYYHSEKYNPDSYHLDKTNLANAAGVELIHVFEDEWAFSPLIVKSIIKNKLGLTENVKYARKCSIKDVSDKDSTVFLDQNHLQGNTYAGVKLGLYENEELIMVATFSCKRSVLGKMPDNWYELVRLCTKIDTVVVGGFSKLLKHFIKKYSPSGIKTFCDKRYFNGAGYEAVGFKLSHVSTPNYFYFKKLVRSSRYMFQKHKLAKKLTYFDNTLTERENMLINGYLRIYDCGNKVFTLDLS